MLYAVDRAAAGGFRLIDEAGASHTFQGAHHGETFVAVFSSHCVPSRMQLSQLDALAKQLAALGVRVIAIAKEDPSPELRRYFDQQKLTFAYYFDPDQEAARVLDAPASPTYLLLDRAGRVRFQSHALDNVTRQLWARAERLAWGGDHGSVALRPASPCASMTSGPVLAVGFLATAMGAVEPRRLMDATARLRIAVEVDCDAGGWLVRFSRAEKQSLLPRLAGLGFDLLMGSPALAGLSSTPERRLCAMNKPPRFAAFRVASPLILVLAAAAAACDTALPTAAEIDAMDVRAAERQAARLQPSTTGSTVYIVDGRQVTAEAALSLTASRISEVELRRSGDWTREGPRTIRIRTVPAEDGRLAPVRLSPREIGIDGQVLRPSRSAPSASGGARRLDAVMRTRASGEQWTPGVPSRGEFAGVIEIDGLRASQSALRALRPEQIESVTVIKRPATSPAAGDDTKASGSLIRVTTRSRARAR
jgi:thiol-disulfide isomerase/thioredoxin